MIHAATHNFRFHADDVFTAALLRVIHGTNVRFSRTRDEEIISNADIVFDVGQIFEPTKNRFDHHQPGGAGERGNGLKYSSFGLVWNFYPPVKTLIDNDNVHRSLDKGFVSSIDASDNGQELYDLKGPVTPNTLGSVIDDFNPSWNVDVEHDTRFREAVIFAQTILENTISRAKSADAASATVKKAIDAQHPSPILVLDQHMPWASAVTSTKHVMYVVYRGAEGNWRGQSVAEKGRPFANRRLFPVAWRGLEKEALVSVCGNSDALFTHNSGFMCVAKTKEAAIDLCQKSLANKV